MRLKTQLLALVVIAGLGSACTKEIGDSCKTATDCSVRGDRICDTSQPDGYCTIRPCDMNNCPDNALCVQFRPDPQRLAENWCMARCDEDSDCRDNDGYRCRRTSELGATTAAVIDPGKENDGFCVIP